MKPDDLATIREQIQKQLQSALTESAAARKVEVEGRVGVGTSASGEVTVHLNWRGLLQQVVYDPAIAGLDAESLREATLEALQLARADLTAQSPGFTSTDPFADTSIRDKYDELFAETFGKEERSQ